MKRKTFLIVLITLISLLLISNILLISPWGYRLHRHVEIPVNYKNELLGLAQHALDSGDYPISCIIVYKNKIIADGYNTVYNKTDITGHAEINALEKVFEKYGVLGFK